MELEIANEESERRVRGTMPIAYNQNMHRLCNDLHDCVCVCVLYSFHHPLMHIAYCKTFKHTHIHMHGCE